MNKRITSTIVLLLLTCLSVSNAVTQPNAVAQPKYGGTIVVALNSDPKYFQPTITSDHAVQAVSCQFYGALVHFDPKTMAPVPYLAEAWQYSEGGKKLTFQLVRNASWSDGKPFTSADVEFTFNEVHRKYHPEFKSNFPSLTRVTATDTHTVVFEFDVPSPSSFSALWEGSGTILPKHIFKGLDIKNNEYNMKPVGTGPFILKEYVAGSHATLVRNEKYFLKGKPYLDSITFRFIQDPEVRATALEIGEVDYAEYLSDSAWKRLKTDPKLVAWNPGVSGSTPQGRLEFNLRNEYFQHEKVREAIAYALDRRTMVDVAYGGIEKVQVSTSPVHYMAGVYHAKDVPVYDFNPAKANQLLDEAGFKRGTDGIRFNAELVHRPDDDETKWASVIRENLNAVGIGVRIVPMERATFTQRMTDWKYDFLLNKYSTGPDPNRAVYRMFHSSQILHLAWSNTMGYSNPEVDRLLDQQNIEVDLKKRAELLHSVQRILMEDLPSLPIADRVYLEAYRAEFGGQLEVSHYGSHGPWDRVWWLKGGLVSKESASEAISSAESKLKDLKSQGYDISASEIKLKAAKDALAKNDWAGAAKLAEEAVSAAIAPPPYATYATVTAVVAIILAITLYKRRKRLATGR